MKVKFLLIIVLISSAFSIVYSADNPPLPFSLISPDSASTTNSLTVKFRWNKSRDIDPGDRIGHYTLIYSNSQNFANPTIKIVTDTSYTATLSDNSIYYWKVSASDLSGDSTFSKQKKWFFVVNRDNDPPKSFSLLSPKNNSIISDLSQPVKLSWQASSDIDPLDSLNYFLISWTRQDKKDSISVKLPQSVTSYSFSNLKDNETYYWYVMVKDNPKVGTSKIVKSGTPWQFFISSTDANKSTVIDLINFPNPFDPDKEQTNIKFTLTRKAQVYLNLYDSAGDIVRELIKNKSMSAGEYYIKWDGKNYANQKLAFGVYICEIITKSSKGEERFYRKIAIYGK